MPSHVTRKPKRRPQRAQTPTLDPELAALASMLAEHEFDEGVKGWLVPPWRDGWNAVSFAKEVHERVEGTKLNWATTRLHEIIHDRESTPDLYWFAQDAITQYHHVYPILAAAYRCFQVRISHNSAGDGSIYNMILTHASVDHSRVIEFVSAQMLEARCRDAIGTTAIMQNDGHDSLRQAFTIAWKRRLYSAAYALKPAK